MSHRAALFPLLALVLSACGGSGKGAAEAVQALLAAQVRGDAAAFEKGIDRPALRNDLRQQITQLAKQSGLDVGGPSDPALDRMIVPDAFHLSLGGAPLLQAPSVPQVAAQLKTLAKDRVCLHDLAGAQACRLVFAQEGGGWRLVAMPADHPTIELAPEPPKKD